MAKGLNSVIGMDLGRHSFKAVYLQKKGQNRFAVCGYAVRPIAGDVSTADGMAGEIRALLKEVGGNAKAHAVATSSRDSMLKIVEQPITPTALLRDAIRLNSTMILNQDCRDWVLDCDLVIPPVQAEGAPPAKRAQYLVGGMPREAVTRLTESFAKARLNTEVLQLAPIATFNAFEFANEDVFNSQAFMIVDVGDLESTVIVGVRRELVLVRSIEFGGKAFIDALVGDGGIERQAAMLLVEQGDAGMAEAGRGALAYLAREIRNSIGFFEGQREEVIGKVFISGALARAEMPLQILSNELDLPCELWDPFQRCDQAMSKAKRTKISVDFVSLNVAFGAALEALQMAR